MLLGHCYIELSKKESYKIDRINRIRMIMVNTTNNNSNKNKNDIKISINDRKCNENKYNNV